MGWWTAEIRRSMLSVRFFACICLVILAQLWWVSGDLSHGHEIGAFYLFIYMTDGPVSILAPIIAAIPFAQSYAMERNGGFSRLVLIRMPQIRYQAIRLLSTALSGGLTLAAPMAGLLVWLRGRYPLVEDINGPLPFFGKSFYPDQVSYMWLTVAVVFLFGATYAAAGLAFSALLRNPYYAVVLPFAAYIVPNVLFGALHLEGFSPAIMWRPSGITTATPAVFAALYAFYWSISLAVYFRCFRLQED